MTDDPMTEKGLSLQEAIERYCDPDKWRRYREAGEAIGWNTRHVRGSSKGKRVQQFKAAENAVYGDYWERMSSRRLVACGREGNPLGPWREIPPDAWGVLKVKNWQQSIVVGLGGLLLFAVRVYEASEVPEIPCEDRPETEESPKSTANGGRGRPTWKDEIGEAYVALKEGAEIDFDAPIKLLYEQIRKKITKTKGTRPKKGLGDEAIRKVISPLFYKDIEEKEDTPHKL